MMRNSSESTNANSGLSSQQSEFLKAFESAKSADEFIKAFKAMESSFDESDLGFLCWILAQELLKKARSKDALVFGEKALNILLGNIENHIPCFGNFELFTPCFDDHNPYLFVARVLNVLGSACYNLDRYNESLAYFNRAYSYLSKLEKDEEENRICTDKCVLRALVSTHTCLYDVKLVMKARCMELGKDNKRDYEALELESEETLPFCLKALEIYIKHFGENSWEVVGIRMSLGAIYESLEEVDKALEQYRLAISGMKCVGASRSRLFQVQKEFSLMLLEADRNEEALEAFNALILLAENIGHRMTRASLLVDLAWQSLSRARRLCNQDRNDDAKKYMEIALRIFEKEEIDAYVRVTSYVDMAEVYEEMKDHEAAFSYLQRAMRTPELQAMGRYDHATKILEKVVAGLKGVEPGNRKLLKDAVKLLNPIIKSPNPMKTRSRHG